MIKKAGRSLGLLFGGNANNGSNAGLVYVNSNNAPSTTNANYGSRHCHTHGYTPGSCTPPHSTERRPRPSAKNIDDPKGAGRNTLRIGYRTPRLGKAKTIHHHHQPITAI